MPDTKTEPVTPVKKREKKASYMVLRPTDEDGTWKLITTSPIPAVSRRAAIIAATRAQEKKDGEFLVLSDKEYSPIKRAIETQTVDKFE